MSARCRETRARRGRARWTAAAALALAGAALAAWLAWSGWTPPWSAGVRTKWDLWAGGVTRLRGANIWQGRNYGGRYALVGRHAIGPRYVQEDFDAMAAAGANYVNLSHPGIFSEDPPYQPDPVIVENLDRLLEMIEAADMFAVIGFRTGPGRNEFTFARDGAGRWFTQDELNEAVWSDRAVQDAWGEMWRDAAARYRTNPIVVGYDLMVEPNGNAVAPDRGGSWMPEGFFRDYAGTLYDWNEMYPRLVAAVRALDPDTPILVGGVGWSGLTWLPYLRRIDSRHLVYLFHHYEPHGTYTHQPPPARQAYPGTFDVNGDGLPEIVDATWLDGRFAMADNLGAPVAVNEFGAHRWAPGVARFLRDSMELIERRGWNHAVWMWHAAAHPPDRDAFNYLHGSDPDWHADIPDNGIMAVIRANWARNSVRPSTAPFSRGGRGARR
ncbi:MAG TPA: cellulase family glycosylhydrolase [Gemmatimonadales bacterium]